MLPNTTSRGGDTVTLHTGLQARAAEAIDRHGVAVTLTRPAVGATGATYSTSTGTMTGGTVPSPWTGVAYFSMFSGEEIDGTAVRVDDLKVYLKAQDLDRPPEVNDIITDGTTSVKIATPPRLVRSKAVPLYYICVGRG